MHCWKYCSLAFLSLVLIILPLNVSQSSDENAKAEYSRERMEKFQLQGEAERLSEHSGLMKTRVGGQPVPIEIALISYQEPIEESAFVKETGIYIAVAFVTGLLLFLFIKLIFRRKGSEEAELKELVASKEKALQEEQERSKQLFDQLNELQNAKSDFFTKFTHELKTPLALILGPIEEILQSDKSEGSDNSYLKMVHRNGVRLREMVNQLLDISKLRHGELNLQSEKFDLIKCCNDDLETFDEQIKKKSIQISFPQKMDSLIVEIDKKAWTTIFTNLISNAIKYSPKQSIISIHIDEDADQFTVEVRDEGIGISKSDQSRIFDLYYQVNAKGSETSGSGIGLALVKELVEKMNGKVYVESELHRGSIFTIVCDRVLDQTILKKVGDENGSGISSVPKVNGTNGHSPKIMNGNGSKAKILLVEDHDDYRDFVSNNLSEFYIVKVASNGEEALEILKEFTPDLIISDIIMPVMDGFEMIDKIRTDGIFNHIPIVFLTVKDSKEDIHRGLDSGADVYLTKPVDKKMLLSQIKALLRRERHLRKQVVEEFQKKKDLSDLQIQVYEVIKRHIGNPDLSMDVISKNLNMSKATLYRKWKAENEQTIVQTITKLRLEEALMLIEEEGLSISEAAFAVGFQNLSYFSNTFKKAYGHPPSEYVLKKKNGE